MRIGNHAGSAGHRLCGEPVAVNVGQVYCPLFRLGGHILGKMSDWELLSEFVRHGSDNAFAELVRRHLNLFIRSP